MVLKSNRYLLEPRRQFCSPLPGYLFPVCSHSPPMAKTALPFRSAGDLFLAFLVFWPWASPCFFGDGAAISFVASSPRATPATSTRLVERVRPTRRACPRPVLGERIRTASDRRFLLHVASAGGDEIGSYPAVGAETLEVQPAEPAPPPAAPVSPHPGAYWQILRPQNIPLSFGLVAAGALVASHAPGVILNPKVNPVALYPARIQCGKIAEK